MDLQGTFE